MVKSQIEGYVSNKTQYLDGVLPAKVINNKAVIYSYTGSIHSNALYLKDQYGQEVHFTLRTRMIIRSVCTSPI